MPFSQNQRIARAVHKDIGEFSVASAARDPIRSMFCHEVVYGIGRELRFLQLLLGGLFDDRSTAKSITVDPRDAAEDHAAHETLL